jgi:hypothetical protein
LGICKQSTQCRAGIKRVQGRAAATHGAASRGARRRATRATCAAMQGKQGETVPQGSERRRSDGKEHVRMAQPLTQFAGPPPSQQLRLTCHRGAHGEQCKHECESAHGVVSSSRRREQSEGGWWPEE